MPLQGADGWTWQAFPDTIAGVTGGTVKRLRIALGQINTVVGDLKGNCGKVLSVMEEAEASGADITCFPELTITGYPPEDLLLKPSFIQENLEVLAELARRVRDMVAVVGFVDRFRKRLYNAAAVIHAGKVKAVCRKMLLPNYGVFDEKRYFSPGTRPLVFSLDGVRVGVSICEDIWDASGPTQAQVRMGATLIININASPYHAGKGLQREVLVRKRCRAGRVVMAYVNLIGGQDELVFDGQSMVVNDQGRILARAGAFREELLFQELCLPAGKRDCRLVEIVRTLPEGGEAFRKGIVTARMGPEEEVYEALVTGVRDYVAKNGFTKVAIGLSGGVDSALVAAIAADALGSSNVLAVFMPSRYSSRESREDAVRLAENLGIRLLEIPIEEIFGSYLSTLSPAFSGRAPDTAEENLQARIRGNILMALSNKFGYLVLTTGNKSEMSVGYATLYGDMAGGYAVIKDVYKTGVYRLARFRNSRQEVIPERILTKEPTAELRENQRDTDTLPPYNALDRILKEYIEKDQGLPDILGMGFEERVVRSVIGMVDRNEYKRRQAPPGIKITPRAFGRDRRMPITNRYSGGTTKAQDVRSEPEGRKKAGESRKNPSHVRRG